MIRFSIIMPAYNAANTIRYSIESIITQSFDNWELIIIDDGSTDNTAEIIKELQLSNKKIVYLYQDNSGPGVARNNGITNSKGEYIAFLDSDDYWDSNFLESVNYKIAIGADYVFYDNYYERPKGKLKGITHISKNRHLEKELIIRKQLTGIIPWGMSKVIKKSLLQNIYFGELTVGEENIFSFEAIRSANSIAFIEKPLYHYVQTEESQHTKGGLDPWGAMLNSIKEYFIRNDYYKQYYKTINSLAVRALIIACYRSSKSTKYRDAINLMKSFMREYRKEYNITDVDSLALDWPSKVLLLFINMGFLTPVYLLSKIR